jgi:hypothetical protein
MRAALLAAVGLSRWHFGVRPGITAPVGRSPRIVAGHVAIGLSARRFWPEHGDAFWMIGVALDLSYSWQNGGQWAH